MNKRAQADSRGDTPGSPGDGADTPPRAGCQEPAATYPRPLPNPRLKDYAERQIQRSRQQRPRAAQPDAGTP